MKRIFTFIIFLMTLAIACEQGNVVFYVNDEVNTTIKSTVPVGLPFDLPIPTVETTADKEYENNNTTPDLIQQVTLENITITITSPSDKTFSFLESIHIYIKKSDDSDKQEIAYLDNINSNAKTITLKTTDANLVPYLKEDTYKLETKTEIKELLLQDVDIRINLKFRVVAQVLKN